MTLLPPDGFAASIAPLVVAVPVMAGARVVVPRFLKVRRPMAVQARELAAVGLLWVVVTVAVVFFAAVDAPTPFEWAVPVSIALSVAFVAGGCVRLWTDSRREARLAAIVRRWLDELEPHSARLRHYVVDPSFSDSLLVHARQAADRGTGNEALEAFATGVVDLERAVEASPGRGAGAPSAEDAAALHEFVTRVRDFDLTGPVA
ncbi:hypothetical protein [Streptomyces sp. NPDC059874]|uniref:hypothetical protein n=1 Tax=Streptomyces sp. NPDC059874 TaxID=3346983 RepID=UPI00365FE1B5